MTERGYRHIISYLVPGWAAASEGDDEGGRVLFSFAYLVDAVKVMTRLSLEARFPSRTPSAGLALIGQERGITRGRNELPDAYARRLNAWRYPAGHRTRGNAFALLRQIYAYFGGAVASETIDRRGNRYQVAADVSATETYEWDGGEFEWDDAPATPRWGRFWIVLYAEGTFAETPDFGDPDLWGGSIDAPAYTLGSTATPADVSAITGLLKGSRAWKPAGTRCEWIIICLTGSTTPVPDPTWGRWSKNDGGNQTRSRPSTMRFWSVYGDEYAGDPDNFPETFDDVEGNTAAITGDPTSFPATITLPDGTTYAGNPDNFPVTITLPDDGS